jgi:hypothetical protein
MPEQAYPFSPLLERHHPWLGELFTYA